MSRPGMPDFPFGQQGRGVLGHQGFPQPDMGIEGNTMESFREALGPADGESVSATEGESDPVADGVELDAIASSDGVVYIYHGSADAEEEARTGLKRRDVLETKDADTIERLVPGIMRLEELVIAYRSKRPWLNIDLETENAAEHVPSLLMRLDALDQVNLASFNRRHREIAAEVLGDGDKAVGYQKVSMSGGIEEGLALVGVALNGNQAAVGTLERSPASRLQLPHEIPAPREYAALVLGSMLGVDVGELEPDIQGNAALIHILESGIFDEEVARNAMVKVQVSAGMVAIAHELGFGVDLWTLETDSQYHRAVEIGTDWLIANNPKDAKQAIEKHRAAA